MPWFCVADDDSDACSDASASSLGSDFLGHEFEDTSQWVKCNVKDGPAATPAGQFKVTQEEKAIELDCICADAKTCHIEQLKTYCLSLDLSTDGTSRRLRARVLEACPKCSREEITAPQANATPKAASRTRPAPSSKSDSSLPNAKRRKKEVNGVIPTATPTATSASTCANPKANKKPPKKSIWASSKKRKGKKGRKQVTARPADLDYQLPGLHAKLQHHLDQVEWNLLPDLVGLVQSYCSMGFSGDSVTLGDVKAVSQVTSLVQLGRGPLLARYSSWNDDTEYAFLPFLLRVCSSALFAASPPVWLFFCVAIVCCPLFSPSEWRVSRFLN